MFICPKNVADSDNVYPISRSLKGNPVYSEEMKIYLAGVESKLHNKQITGQVYSNPGEILVLGSFFGISQRNQKMYSSLLPCFKDFMLDSGAYSFMNSQSCERNWESYLEKYAAYVKEHKVEKYFELDIDSIVGYDKVKEYRAIIERMVNRPCIPVWHRSRGYDEFLRLCDEYSYVAVGGIAIRHIRRTEYQYFTQLIKEAHRRNCKIHALGFTNLSELRKYHFDSVDSSTWTCGGRYGSIYKFSNGRMRAITRNDNMRVSDIRGIDGFNFVEWVKFQKYSEVHM